MELLDMVGLSGLHRRYPHQLSGGQQQRVALARALATDPEVVLLDEPFSSLDASLRASVRKEVHDVLRASGATSLLVTHDQDEALSLADQVAVLRNGVVAQVATPSALYDHPADVDVARFLGESNVLDAEVRDAWAETALGRLEVGDWSGGAGSRSAHVLIRPEQIELGAPTGTGLAGTVATTEYYGHDAVVRVKTDVDDLPELVVRLSGDVPPTSGSRVGITVRGTVVAWPR